MNVLNQISNIPSKPDFRRVIFVIVIATGLGILGTVLQSCGASPEQTSNAIIMAPTPEEICEKATAEFGENLTLKNSNGVESGAKCFFGYPIGRGKLAAEFFIGDDTYKIDNAKPNAKDFIVKYLGQNPVANIGQK